MIGRRDEFNTSLAQWQSDGLSIPVDAGSTPVGGTNILEVRKKWTTVKQQN